MKIAIHNRPGSFSDIWINYFVTTGIPYKLVNCYDTDIINQLDGCDGLMWHWDITEYQATLCARQLTLSLQSKNIKVFPDVNTAWHYDDKVGQKYLLEAIGAPLIKSYVFYSKPKALEWLETASLPKVFKLRNGAGSSNVKLVKSKHDAKHLINKAFRNGFANTNSIGRLKERIWMLRRDKNLLAVKRVITGIARLFIANEVDRFSQTEKGYIYFQDFIPQNEYDIRLVVIGNRCFGLVRYCRKGDFRASGSGLKSYNHKNISTNCVKIAFETAQKLKMQSVAFDFINHNNTFKLIEISYAFTSDSFPGYWDEDLSWIKGNVCPQKFMAEEFANSIYEFKTQPDIVSQF